MSVFEQKMEQLRDRFRARAADDRVQLLAALDASDVERIRSIAHGLSGSGGVFGFPAISAAAERVERAADEGETDAVRREAEALLIELAALSQPA